MSREPDSGTYGLMIPKDVDVGFTPALLTRAMRIVGLHHHQPYIDFDNESPIEAAQSHEIFQAMENSHVHHGIAFAVSHNEGFMSEVRRHIQVSTSLQTILFTNEAPVSLQAIRFIFDAIADSTSLEDIWFCRALVAEADLDVATGILAKSLAKSESLREVRFVSSCASSFTMERTCRFLAQTDAVKTFDLSFDDETNGMPKLTLTRRWKRLLPLEMIPLAALWPRILGKAKRPKWKATSHDPKSTLYFLLKEKNGILRNANGPRHTCALCSTTFPKTDDATDKPNHCAKCDSTLLLQSFKNEGDVLRQVQGVPLSSLWLFGLCLLGVRYSLL